jgi:hypothetical protein
MRIEKGVMMGLHQHLRDEIDLDSPPKTEEEARQQAIKQIGRRRLFGIQAVSTAVVMVILVVIWALSEYHNAGGWPTHGFSQSSGIHDVWNFWIIYPVIGLGLLLGVRAWSVYGNKPLSEQEIKREIERRAETDKSGHKAAA